MGLWEMASGMLFKFFFFSIYQIAQNGLLNTDIKEELHDYEHYGKISDG